jgi:cobalt-zinc-cadmium efflux system outer membrane protein
MTLIGLPSEKINILDNSILLDSLPAESPEILVTRALAARPDLRAAEIAIESAGEKLGWEKSKIFSLSALLDANAQGKEGFEMGPGLQGDLPIFNWNNAGRTRAETEMQQAALNYRSMSQKIISEVLQAYNNYQAAREALFLYQEIIIPKAVTAAQNAENAYRLGESSYIEFLVFKRQMLNSKLMGAEAEAELRRSIANLQFCVGSNIIHNESMK